MGTSSPFLCLDPLQCTLPCSTPSTSLVPLPGAIIPIETGGCWAISVQSRLQPAFLRFKDGYCCKTSIETARSWSWSNRKDVMNQQWQSSPLQPIQSAVWSGLRDGWVKAWRADDPKCVICIKTLEPSGFPLAVPHPPALVKNCVCMGCPIQHKQITVKIQTTNGDVSFVIS